MVDELTKNQSTMLEQLLKNLGDTGLEHTHADNTPASAMFEFYQSLTKSLTDNFDQTTDSQTAQSANNQMGDMGIPEAHRKHIEQIWNANSTLLKLLTDSVNSDPENEQLNGFYTKSLEQLMNPAIWINRAGGDFDSGIEKFSEGSADTVISEINKAVTQVNEGWMDLRNASNAYHTVILSCWTRSYDQFLKLLSDKSAAGKQPSDIKEYIDDWNGIANENLVEMHRTGAFLDAQRDLLRAGMKYRLQERAVAQNICEMMHIPTQDEVEELQKNLHALRRQVRSMQKEIVELRGNQQGTKAKKASAHKVTGKTSAKRSPSISARPAAASSKSSAEKPVKGR